MHSSKYTIAVCYVVRTTNETYCNANETIKVKVPEAIIDTTGSGRDNKRNS